MTLPMSTIATNQNIGFGWANTRFFIDPTSGVAAILNMQMIPTVDKDIAEVAAKLETALYAGLE